MTSLFNHACPNCGEDCAPKYQVLKEPIALTWYGCRKCRHHWHCVGSSNGAHLKIAAESPYTGKANITAYNVAGARSPCCGTASRIKETIQNHPRGVVRRHVCRSCAGWFFTTVDDEGQATITNERPSRVTLEVT